MGVHARGFSLGVDGNAAGKDRSLADYVFPDVHLFCVARQHLRLDAVVYSLSLRSGLFYHSFPSVTR